MNKVIISVFIFLTLNAIIGCVPRTLEPDAKNVAIAYDQNNQIAKTCQFLGKVSNKDVHGKELQFTWGLEKNLEIDDINFLKNEGLKLGANVVVFEKHQILIERHNRAGGRHTDISMHVIEGSAYRCTSQMISAINKSNITKQTVYENPVVIKNY